MRNLTIALLILFVSVTNAQEKKGKILKEIFKYSTFYGAYSQTNAIQNNQTFYVTQQNELIETTQKNPADFMMTYGWRKLANFQYEDRNRFYIGDENNASTKSNIGNVKGLEYLFQYSTGRQQGREFENQQAFIRYLAKWWLVKGEYKKNELVDLNYKSAEARARFAIGKKLSLSLGVAYRTYDKAYGHNPIEAYLQDNNWWDLSYSVGHTDELYQMVSTSGQSMGYDYQWFDADGVLLSNSDLDYRNNVFQDVVNNYNKEQLSMIGGFQQISAIAGLDFYHYRNNFWVHIYGNVLPYHELLSGDERYSYDNFYGSNDYIDYSAGGVIGIRITKNIGLYGEINLQRYWDREIRSIKAGVNIKI